MTRERLQAIFDLAEELKTQGEHDIRDVSFEYALKVLDSHFDRCNELADIVREQTEKTELGAEYATQAAALVEEVRVFQAVFPNALEEVEGMQE